MSLVAYGSSGEESEDEEQGTVVAAAVRKPLSASLPAPKNMNEDDTEEEDTDEEEPGMFAALPAPKEGEDVPEEEVEVPKPVPKKRAPVKITVPSLAQFKAEDDQPKRKQPKATGSGLFAVLPPPKKKAGATSLIPYSLTKKPAPKPKAQKPEPDADEASTSGSGDFFSLNAAPDMVMEMPPDMLAMEYPTLKQLPVTVKSEDEAGASGSQPQPEPEEEIMDEAAILRLHGKRRRNEEINIIDISADAIIPDAKEWLLKQLTEEKQETRSHSHKKKGGPTAQQRRKHQITYLAFEAKERELELKNQWAQNRVTRKQTQLKYGF